MSNFGQKLMRLQYLWNSASRNWTSKDCFQATDSRWVQILVVFKVWSPSFQKLDCLGIKSDSNLIGPDVSFISQMFSDTKCHFNWNWSKQKWSKESTPAAWSERMDASTLHPTMPARQGGSKFRGSDPSWGETKMNQRCILCWSVHFALWTTSWLIHSRRRSSCASCEFCFCIRHHTHSFRLCPPSSILLQAPYAGFLTDSTDFGARRGQLDTWSVGQSLKLNCQPIGVPNWNDVWADLEVFPKFSGQAM